MPDDRDLLLVLAEAAGAVRAVLDTLDDWGPAGTKPGQYRSDLAADDAAVRVLDGAGLGVLSEESGLHGSDRELLAVLDPVDGSTNAFRGVPWFATSICVVDGAGPRAAVVVNQATGTRFEAVRGGGATRDGRPIGPSTVDELARAVVGLSGFPPRHLGWRQYRTLGAAALDLCAVASGMFDAWLDCSPNAHGPWDYLGGMLVCQEAGGVVADVEGRELVVTGHQDRRTPAAAGSAELLKALLTAFAGELRKKD